MKYLKILFLISSLFVISTAKIYDSVSLTTTQTSNSTCKAEIVIHTDTDNDNDLGSDPDYLPLQTLFLSNLYAFIEIFHGEDRLNPKEKERSLQCVITYEGMGMPLGLS